MGSSERAVAVLALGFLGWACGSDGGGSGPPVPGKGGSGGTSAAAGTSGTGGTAATGGTAVTGGTGGSGGSSFPGCEAYCEKQVEMACDGEAITQAQCVGGCQFAWGDNWPWCASEFQGWASCLAARPNTDFTCSGGGDGVPNEGICEASFDVLNLCYNNGPGSGLPDATSSCPKWCSLWSTACGASVPSTCQADCEKWVSGGLDGKNYCRSAFISQLLCLTQLATSDFECKDGKLALSSTASTASAACMYPSVAFGGCKFAFCANNPSDPLCQVSLP